MQLHDNTSTLAAAIGLGFGCIHFIDFSVERAAADAELFGRGGHIAVRRCKRLGDQSSFRLMEIETKGGKIETHRRKRR